MLAKESHLIEAMGRLGEYAQAEALDRESPVKRLRVLGRDHHQTLYTSTNLALFCVSEGLVVLLVGLAYLATR